MRELDAILSPIYETDSVLFAAWKAAIAIQRAPETVTQTTPPSSAASAA
jgi:hypothetical protein